MLLTTEMLEEYADKAQEVLEEQVADGDVVRVAIGVFKDDRLWIWVFPEMDHGRDNILNACYPIIVGMEPDSIIISNDSYQLRSKTNPRMEMIDGVMKAVKRDGTPWGNRDMQYARENNTEDAQDITDALVVSYYDRLGNAALVSRNYDVGEDGKVTWDKREVLVPDEKGHQFKGVIPEAIEKMFKMETLTQRFAKMAEIEEEIKDIDSEALAKLKGTSKQVIARLLGMSIATGMSAQMAMEYVNNNPEEAYAHQICAVLKMGLIPQHCSIALPVHSLEVLEVFSDSLAEFHPQMITREDILEDGS